MYALLPTRPRLPTPPIPWRSLASLCEIAIGAVHTTVRTEFENNLRFFAELDFREEDQGDAITTGDPLVRTLFFVTISAAFL
jgi:hypothetical protein